MILIILTILNLTVMGINIWFHFAGKKLLDECNAVNAESRVLIDEARKLTEGPKEDVELFKRVRK